MSTITQKIAAILGIKSDIKDAINAKGGSLTAASPFTSYAAAIAAIQTGASFDKVTLVQSEPSTLTAAGYIASITAYPAGGVGAYGFYGATQLTSIPSIGCSVGAYAFYGCTGLSALTLGSGASLAANSFRGCTNIGKVTVAVNDPAAVSIDAVAFGDVPTCHTHYMNQDTPTDYPQTDYGRKQGSGLWICVPDGYVQAFRTAWPSLSEFIFNEAGTDEVQTTQPYDNSGGGGGSSDDPINPDDDIDG